MQALHIHDNNLHDDLHRIPLTVKMDYEPILAALAEVNYGGVFTLEAYKHLDQFKGQDVLLHVREMAESARKLSEKYDMIRSCKA